MKIYLASSWRNHEQPELVKHLRAEGHQVYDFREPHPGGSGFSWREIDPDWQNWTPGQFRTNVHHDIATEGFSHDWSAMVAAEIGVLALPSGRSAHIEAGYFVGAGKPLIIYAPVLPEPELMYRMGLTICLNRHDLIACLRTRLDDMVSCQADNLKRLGRPDEVSWR